MHENLMQYGNFGWRERRQTVAKVFKILGTNKSDNLHPLFLFIKLDEGSVLIGSTDCY